MYLSQPDTPKKLLAKDSINQLFDKDYNRLCLIYGGLMKAKIRNEMIMGLAFSTASAVSYNFLYS